MRWYTWLAGVAVVALLLAIFAIPWFSGVPLPWDVDFEGLKADELAAARATMAAAAAAWDIALKAAGGLALVFGLFIAWRRSEAAMVSAKATLLSADAAFSTANSAHTSQIGSRFTQAIDQLGALNPGDHTEHVVLRLGGIYGLEQIARGDPENHHLPVIEVLASYVRQNAKQYPGIIDFDGSNSPPEDVAPNRVHGPEKPREDIQAALVVIGRLGAVGAQEIKLRHIWLRGAIFPYGAKLQAVDFDSSNLMDADFTGAILTGTGFNNANLRGTCFRDAEMNETNLNYANLTWYEDGGNIPHFTELQGASLHRAVFEGADISGALLQGVDLSDARVLTRQQICSSDFDKRTTMPNGKAGYTRAQVCEENLDVGLWDEKKRALEQEAIAAAKAEREQFEDESGEKK